MQYVSGTADSAVVTVRILDAGSIDANFSGVTYTVQLSSSNNNYGTVSPAIEQVSHNGGFTAIASVKRGCRFLEWVVDSGTMTIDDPYNDTTSVSSVLSGGKIKGLFAEARPVPSKIVCVDINSIGPSGQEDGSTWYRAYKSLETAIADCTTAGTNFWVAEGTYTPSGSDPFKPKSNTSFYGGFSSHDSLFTERDFVERRVVISNGSHSTEAIIVQVNDIIIDGLIIFGENTNGINLYVWYASSFLVKNCIITSDNSVKREGCYIEEMQGETKIENCVFTRLNGIRQGALKLKDSDSVKIVNSIFFDNEVSTEGSGAISISGAKVYIINTTIVNNKLNEDVNFSNSIYKYSGDATVKMYNSIIWNDPSYCNNNKVLINKIDSTYDDCIWACLLDSVEVESKILNSFTWRRYNDGVPMFLSTTIPGGLNNEKWFLSSSGLVFSNTTSPGCQDGWRYEEFNNCNLEWDIRGQGFARIVNSVPDCGA